jgi:hypothetical protein
MMDITMINITLPHLLLARSDPYIIGIKDEAYMNIFTRKAHQTL